MKAPSAVLVVSANPLIAEGVLRRLEPAAQEIQAEIVMAPALAGGPPRQADAAVLAFGGWVPMAAWLPIARRQLATMPWLVLADAVLAGAFFPSDEPHLCTVATHASDAADLRSALIALASGRTLHPPAELIALFLSGAPPPPRGRPVPHPTPAQFRAGCALALGLTGPQIASILYVAPSTVKSHLDALRAKLHTPGRAELAELFRQALAPRPPR